MSYFTIGAAVIGTATSVAGTVMSANAQKQQGQAQKQALVENARAAIYKAGVNSTMDKYRANISDYNAALSDLSATMDEQKAVRYEGEANAQADIVQRGTTRMLGKITAAYGAAGVTGNSGSELAVLHDNQVEGELSRKLTLYQGATAAADSRYQGVLDQSQGVLQRTQSTIYRAAASQEEVEGNMAADIYMAGGQAVENAANLGAGATLLTGAGRAASSASNLLNFYSKSGGSDSIPTPASQGISVGSVGDQPRDFYTGGAPSYSYPEVSY